jgi:DNA polymerase-3 subunit alpha
MPVEIAARVEELGCPCCGLTDHGNVAGHLEFVKACHKRGIKPLPGVELYHGVLHGQALGRKRDANHLILLPKTDRGLKNIWRIVSAASHPDQVHHVPRATTDQLRMYREDVWATSACALGRVPRGLVIGDLSALDEYLDIYRDNFLIELSTYDADKPFNDANGDDELLTTRKLNIGLADLAEERGIECTIGDDAHYARKEDYEFADVLVARRTGDTIFTPPEERTMWHPNTLYIKSEAEVREALSYLPQRVVDNAIANTERIAEESNVRLPEVSRQLPIFIPGDCEWLSPERKELSAGEVFIDLIIDGIMERYPAAGDDIWERAYYEIETFLESGLEHMFLMDWDKNQFCDLHGILRGPGRGSAAGSIVAYALGITDVDPIHYSLYFERFWNPGRAKGFPDIDTDYARKDRQTIIQYLKDKWGEKNVALIGNVNRLKPKAALEKMQKPFGISDNEVDVLKAIVNEVPDIDILGSDSIAWSRETDPDFVLDGKVRTIYVDEHVGDELEEWLEAQPAHRRKYLRAYIRQVSHSCNRGSGYGVHASGVVVSPIALEDYAPINTRGDKNDRKQATEFAMDDIDKLMLVKLDVLGLKTLDTLAEWQAEVAEKGIELDWSGLDKLEWPDEMWQLLADGYSAGIFQVEGGYASHIAKEFKPRSVEDMSIIVALNRPGPKRSGAPESFILRRRGEEDDKFDGRKISLLEPILNVTYGWFLYQEQVMEYFRALGYNLSDADAVRKILGKKQPEKWLDMFHGREEWEGKGYMQAAEAAGLGRIEGTAAAKWNGEEVSGKHEFAKSVKLDAWVIWKMIVDFAKYSFNKAHSVAYGIIGFRTLLAKYYAPAEFYLSCIRTVEDNKKVKLIPTYINEARRMSITVRPPDIERSQAAIKVWNDGDIYWGLGDVRDVGMSGDYVVHARDELGAPVNTPDALFEWIESSANEVKKDRAKRRKNGEVVDKSEKTPKQMLGGNKITALYTAGAWERLEGNRTPIRELQSREKEMLAVILTDDSPEILMRNQKAIDNYNCDMWEEAILPYQEDRCWRLPGTIIAVNETTVKTGENRGKAMGIVTIEHEGFVLDFPVFSKQWQSYRFFWHERSVGLFNIRHSINNRTGEPGYSFKDGIKLS